MQTSASENQRKQKIPPVDNKNVTVQGKAAKRLNEVTEKDRKMFASVIDPYDVPLTWWETDCVKYAMSYAPVRTRLMALMDSDVVRLTDRKYILLLMSKTRDNYEAEQKTRIEGRKLAPASIVSQLLMISDEALRERVRKEGRDEL